MKLQYNKLNQQYFLTIPRKLVKAKKWVKGQELTIIFNERGNLELEED